MKLKKIVIWLVTLMQVFCCSTLPVYASSIEDNSDYPRNETITYNGKAIYGKNIVGDFSIGNQMAFCLQHPLTTPATGTKVTSSVYENEDVRKVLYYGYGGPAQWSGFKDRQHGIVITSLALSYFYYGDKSSSIINDFLDFIKDKSIPNFSVNFSKEKVQAYKDGDIQRTETIELKSDDDLYSISASLPSEVTYVDETHSTRQKGGNITIKGQTKFHLEAPLNVKLSSWSTGKQTSAYAFEAIVSKPSSSALQQIGRGMYLSDKSHTTSLSVDWLQLANLEIQKTDVYNQLVDGAIFKLWNNEGYSRDITVTNGHIVINDLMSGIYYLQEQQAPDGFLLDETIYTVRLNAGDTGKQVISNKEPVGKISVKKENNLQDGIAGAKFEIRAKNDIYSAGGKLLLRSGDIVDTIVSSSQGIAMTKEIPLGTYIIKEIEAPYGYLLNTEEYEAVLQYANQTTELITYSTSVLNKEPLGNIQLHKEIDASQTDNKIGDALLSDIHFGLYAKTDIFNAAKTKTYYHKDELILEKVTDQEGKITWTDLPMGEYYIKELSVNDSVLINHEVIYVTLTYQDMQTKEITVQTKMTDQIASQRIQIFKEGVKDGQTGIVKGLAGAEFTFVLNDDYEKLGFDKAKPYFVGTTDENGYLTTSLLPYGTYRVKETKTPQGYYGASDFIVKVEKDASLYEIGYQIKKVTVNNLPFESLLKIIKTDQTTGKTVQVAGATFKIKNLDTKEYVSYVDWSAFPQINVNQWTTHDDGSVTLNTKLKVGHYQLEEIKAPQGYLLNDQPIPFEINQKDYEIADDQVTPITIVKCSDISVKGKVTVEKKGEVFVDYKDDQFIYESRGLPGSEFGIYANTDIIDASHDGTIIYHQGELIETLITDENGKATSQNLPLGEYVCKELKAPYGYVLNEEIRTFELSYENQKEAIVYTDVSVYNERQKIAVKVSKKDEETKELVAGAEFSLFANRDIYNYKGEVIVKAGTKIETITSTKEIIAFQSDLPLDLTPEYAVMPIDDELIGDTNSLYVIKETKVPDGYVSKDVSYYIDAKYTNEHESVLNFENDFYNQQTQTLIQKIDAQTSLPVTGAKLQLIDAKTNTVIDEWVSDEEGHAIKGLLIDHPYIVRELEAPEGYLLAKDQVIYIYDTDKVQTITFVNEKKPVITLSDEPEVIVETQDQTLIWSYLLMGMAAMSVLFLVKKRD